MWVITYQRVTTPAHARWRDWLAHHTASYAKLADRSFHWVRVERYDERRPQQ
jgi:hypothetical protein